MRPLEHQVIQISWVVRNLEEAAARWHRTMGIGPFLVNRHISIAEPLYRGRPGTADFSTAIAQAGPVQIELVEQHDDRPSCYRDMVPKGREGMHHVAVFATNYDQTVASYTDQGFEVASSGCFGDIRFCYVDTCETLGHMVEILEDKPTIRAFFGAIERAAEKWDGDPATLLRELG